MARVNVTLQPSKKIVTLAAAQIYSAYIHSRGLLPEDEVEQWIDRAVREAIAIAHLVDISIQSDEELPDDGKQRLRDLPDDHEFPNLDPRT